MAFLLPGGVRRIPGRSSCMPGYTSLRPGFAFLAGKQKFSLLSASLFLWTIFRLRPEGVVLFTVAFFEQIKTKSAQDADNNKHQQIGVHSVLLSTSHVRIMLKANAHKPKMMAKFRP